MIEKPNITRQKSFRLPVGRVHKIAISSDSQYLACVMDDGNARPNHCTVCFTQIRDGCLEEPAMSTNSDSDSEYS